MKEHKPVERREKELVNKKRLASRKRERSKGLC